MNNATVAGIINDLRDHYAVVIDEQHIAVDDKTKSYKAHYISDIGDSGVVVVVDGDTNNEFLMKGTTAMFYIFRGNAEGDTFRLREIREAGRQLLPYPTPQRVPDATT